MLKDHTVTNIKPIETNASDRVVQFEKAKLVTEIRKSFNSENVVEKKQQAYLTEQFLTWLGVQAIHYGCGHFLFPLPFLNMDISPINELSSRKSMLIAEDSALFQLYQIEAMDGTHYYYMRHNAEELLPFASHSVSLVYSEHFIEHVSRPIALFWLQEIRRIIKPLGGLRVTTPDLELYVEGYRDPEKRFYNYQRDFLLGVGSTNLPKTKAFIFNQLFYYWEHKWIYDFEEIKSFLMEAGFSPEAIFKRSYGEGNLPLLCQYDLKERCHETLYVEAVALPTN